MGITNDEEELTPAGNPKPTTRQAESADLPAPLGPTIIFKSGPGENSTKL